MPPPAVIARGTEGVFEFVKNSVIPVGARNVLLDFREIDLKRESRGELPVPPDVIARGTEGTFEYVKSNVESSGIPVRGTKFFFDRHEIDLKSWSLKFDELTLLLGKISNAHFSSLQILNLVSSVCVQNCSRFLSLM